MLNHGALAKNLYVSSEDMSNGELIEEIESEFSLNNIYQRFKRMVTVLTTTVAKAYQNVKGV